MKKEVLLCSAGIDSWLAYKHLLYTGHQIDLIYFDLKTVYSDIEIEYVKKNYPDVQIISDLNLGRYSDDTAYIPNRNLLMTMMVNTIGYNKIWIANTLSDRVGDGSSYSREKLSELISMTGNHRCVIDSPFGDVYKEDLVKTYSSWAYDNSSELVRNTFSCFAPLDYTRSIYAYDNGLEFKYDSRECLNCDACFRKAAVMNNADIFIPMMGNHNKHIFDKYRLSFDDSIIINPRSSGTNLYITKSLEYYRNEGDVNGN